MTTTTGYKVVILSDLHLGMNDSKPKKILNYLDTITTDLLILNGDIIDIDALRRGSKWKNSHMKVLIKILEMSRNTDVIYVRGNHDDNISELFNIETGNIKFVDEYILTVGKNRFLVFHGDKIDATTKYKLLTHIGSVGYDIALRMNTWYNKYRELRGKPYYSISKVIKENFKKALTFISDFEHNACEYAKTKNCNGVICGHIHIPVMKVMNGIEYYNSGDWVENFTSLVLNDDNTFELKITE